MKASTNLILTILLTASISCKRKISVPGGSIEQDGDQVTIKTPGGGSLTSGGNVSLPEGFPDDVPQPEGILEVAMKMPQGFNVSFICESTPNELFKKMGDEFKTKAWEEVVSMQQGQGGTLGFKKGENRHVQCTIATNRKTGKTVVNLTVTKR